MTKFYSSASNVRRAIKTVIDRNKLTGVDFVVTETTTEENVRAFIGTVQIPHDMDPAPFADFVVMVAPDPEVEEVVQDAPKVPRAPKATHVNESSVEKPVALVKRIAQEMFDANPNVTRKEVLTKLREMGVATHTAATQYARWKSGK